MILLEDQQRGLWNPELIAEGTALAQQALLMPGYGPYSLQAAISALHGELASVAATDWPQIVSLYDLLLQIAPSAVVEINRAVAVSMRDGPAAGLALIDAILARGELQDYSLAHAARAELCRRLGRTAEARTAYRQALALAQQEPERRYLERRILDLAE